MGLTFKERKAQRIADANKKFVFVVEDPVDFSALATFRDAASAKKYTEENLTVWLGDTAAYRALCAKHPNQVVSHWHHFNIKKVEVA